MQISFFAGFMALDAYREAKSKQDCCPCCCVESLNSRVAQGQAKSGCCCFKPCYDKFDCLPPYGLKPFLKKYYIPMLHSKGVKAVVIVAFVAWAAASAWMVTLTSPGPHVPPHAHQPWAPCAPPCCSPALGPM